MAETEARFAEGYPAQYKKDGVRHDFPIKFRWQIGLWFELFEKHAEFIIEDIDRAKVDNRLIVYLSCPISNYGGSYSRTNIEIAAYVEQRLISQWGSRFWILNPALYQLDSRHGTGLIKRHARTLSLEKRLKKAIDIEELQKESPVTGGDYMRMWTRVILEDDNMNLGERFGAFYFVGPSDVQNFFIRSGGADLTKGIEEYYARKLTVDPEFRKMAEADPENFEHNFFRYYAIMAGSYFSRGSNDEYIIWRVLNKLRREQFGIASQIPGYFDGRQLGFETISPEHSSGYAAE